MAWRGSTRPLDRLYGCLPYLLPMAAVVPFGAQLFEQFPLLVIVYLPFIWLFGNVLNFAVIPNFITGEFVVFLLIFFFVVRNQRILHFIRFNAMQSLLLEITLFIIGILRRFIIQAFGGFTPIIFLTHILESTVFVGISVVFVYSVFQCVRGRYAEIPVVSEAAYYQVR